MDRVLDKVSRDGISSAGARKEKVTVHEKDTAQRAVVMQDKFTHIVQLFQSSPLPDLYNKMADTLDANYAGAPISSSPIKGPTLVSPRLPIVPGSERSTVNAEAIKSVLKVRNWRVSDLASHFDTTPDEISRIINSDDSLFIADRGWVKEGKEHI